MAAVTNGIRRFLLSATGLQLDVPLSGSAVQSGPDDVTAGRLLRVGAYGMGGDALNVTSLNDAVPGAISRFEVNDTDKPGPANSAGICHTARWSAGSITQTAHITFPATSENQLWTRLYTGTTWGPWRPVYSARNAVGAVSQSGGVPTGALFERPTQNGNGWFRRQADGFMECRHVISTSDSSGVAWTFPGGAFVEAPNVQLTPVATVAVNVMMDAAPGTTSVTISARNTAGTRLVIPVHAVVKGRWSALT